MGVFGVQWVWLVYRGCGGYRNSIRYTVGVVDV